MGRQQSTRRNPTNAEIIKEVRALARTVDMIPQLRTDVDTLLAEQHDREIAKKAVEAYIKATPKTVGSDQWLNRELLKALLIALGLVAAALALLKGN